VIRKSLSRKFVFESSIGESLSREIFQNIQIAKFIRDISRIFDLSKVSFANVSPNKVDISRNDVFRIWRAA